MKRPVGSPPRAEAAGAAMPPARVCPAHERKKRQLFKLVWTSTTAARTHSTSLRA